MKIKKILKTRKMRFKMMRRMLVTWERSVLNALKLCDDVGSFHDTKELESWHQNFFIPVAILYGFVKEYGLKIYLEI